MEQDTPNIGLNRTDVPASTAKRRGERQVRRRRSEEIRADDRADRTGVGHAVGMTADPPIDRTDIEARAAAQAVKRLAQNRIGEHAAAPVIDHHDVDFAWPVEVAVGAWSVDK